jgi:hypothetical protein
MLSEKQLPSIMILSSYDMPTLHGESVTGVCSFNILQIYQNSSIPIREIDYI